MLERLKKLLFPPKCMLCGRLLGEKEEICSACRAEIYLNTAPPRLSRKAGFDAATAGLWYQGQVRNAIHGLKYREKQSYARPLARVMAYTVQNKLEESYDLVTFVPSNRRTERNRGYNQAELLARELAEMLSLPCIRTLEKRRTTRAMHDLTPEQRMENVRDAYRICCAPELLAGKCILLADDVLTTGATLSECAFELKRNGASAVFGICAAATERKNQKV